MRSIQKNDSKVGRVASRKKERNLRDSLVLTSTCCCDLSRLGAELCEFLNEAAPEGTGPWVAVDAADIRHWAGDGSRRSSIFSAAPDPEPGDRFRTDFERVARGIAARGGVVLSGQACFEATKDQPNVLRFMVSTEECCGDGEEVRRFDPRSSRRRDLVRAIGEIFFEWSASRRRSRAGEASRR